MRLEKLPDEGHDKVIWSRERSRDGTGDKASRQSYFETWWRRNTATLLGVSFGRRRWDVLMGWSGYVPLRCLGDIPQRRQWVFHLRLVWDVVETYWWDVVVTSPWDVIMTYQKDVVKTYHWDVLVMFYWHVVGCFIWDVPATSLGRTERRRYDVTTTLCCRVCWQLLVN